MQSGREGEPDPRSGSHSREEGRSYRYPVRPGERGVGVGVGGCGPPPPPLPPVSRVDRSVTPYTGVTMLKRHNKNYHHTP